MNEEMIMKHTALGRYLPIQELVRCKDCELWDENPSSSAFPEFHECHRFVNKYSTTAIDFCSKGAKRDE